MSERYLECISGTELERLQAQHEAWLPETRDLLRDAGFGDFRKILEVGCGPGFVALEIASALNPNATVTASDISDYYLNHLRKEIEARAIRSVNVVGRDLMQPDQALGVHDAAFCRWFLAWVTRGIDQTLANVRNSLRVGGIFAAMEYLTLRSVCHAPPCAALGEYVNAWEAFYRDCGGTTELGSSLPEKLKEHGFEILDVRCVGGYAPQGHRLYSWWRRCFEDFHEKFRDLGLLSEGAIASLKEYWQSRDAGLGGFIYSPVLVQVIARKK